MAKLMSDRLKAELAREMGVADLVEHDGWGSVPSRNCGMLVRMAIERAERLMNNEQ